MADPEIFEPAGHQSAPCRAGTLMNVATCDAAVACWGATYTYWAMRPFHDPHFTPIIRARAPELPRARNQRHPHRIGTRVGVAQKVIERTRDNASDRAYLAL